MGTVTFKFYCQSCEDYRQVAVGKKTTDENVSYRDIICKECDDVVADIRLERSGKYKLLETGIVTLNIEAIEK